MSPNNKKVLTRNDVDRFVSVHIEMNSPMSAWDITKELRNDGYWAPHNEVREFVHELMQPIIDSNSGWLKTNVTLDTGVTFQVYYNSQENLDSYIEDVNSWQEADFDDNDNVDVTKSCSTNCRHVESNLVDVIRNPFRKLLDTVGNFAGSIFK